MTQYHELKTDPEVFDAVVAGKKTFEIRLDDRHYQLHDILVLRKMEFTGEEMKGGKPLNFIGQPFYVYVTYILHGPIYGLGEGWVIMALQPWETEGVR